MKDQVCALDSLKAISESFRRCQDLVNLGTNLAKLFNQAAPTSVITGQATDT
jgi:hypothetical protein